MSRQRSCESAASIPSMTGSSAPSTSILTTVGGGTSPFAISSSPVRVGTVIAFSPGSGASDPIPSQPVREYDGLSNFAVPDSLDSAQSSANEGVSLYARLVRSCSRVSGSGSKAAIWFSDRTLAAKQL
nr:hypothetical protein [Halocatena pleomorpha]